MMGFALWPQCALLPGPALRSRGSNVFLQGLGFKTHTFNPKTLCKPQALIALSTKVMSVKSTLKTSLESKLTVDPQGCLAFLGVFGDLRR